MPTKTLDHQLDEIVTQLQDGDLTDLIDRTEAKVRMLRALKDVCPPPSVGKTLKPARPAKKRKARTDDSKELDDFEDPPAEAESMGSRASNKLGRQRSIAHLLKNGPMLSGAIAAEIGISQPTVISAINGCPWFVQAVRKGPFALTDEGRAAINGKPDVQTLKPERKKISASDLPEKLGEFLKANGPKRSDAIRNALGVEWSQLDGLIVGGHPWFEKDGNMYRLTQEGHTHFSREQEP